MTKLDFAKQVICKCGKHSNMIPMSVYAVFTDGRVIPKSDAAFEKASKDDLCMVVQLPCVLDLHLRDAE